MKELQLLLENQPDWLVSLKFGLFVLGFCLLALATRELLAWFLKLGRLQKDLTEVKKNSERVLKKLEKMEKRLASPSPANTEKEKESRRFEMPKENPEKPSKHLEL